ncbi:MULTISPECIES: GDSL-type esterase/lipase family protein [unclassified Saccharibacter]|uniref:GDSL-type esterase/lipase family protein n=1 Tax=unclassified Saccharibacter TaxID=2648722 RepID=UPI001324B1AB|nr:MULTISPECIES: GDSL-type esterase/lipase family protein [unclassified Saccharibacter]MXV35141.1 hypothetical protein [Saccharibacter sp. EH611]MXV57312.1 hypothetical protein [Saccharibacter sp. EH70]MXV64827.1 hypothetical protein [Saccharibacter sp. EH60]
MADRDEQGFGMALSFSQYLMIVSTFMLVAGGQTVSEASAKHSVKHGGHQLRAHHKPVHHAPLAPLPTESMALTNYGDPNLWRFSSALQRANTQTVHIVQFGDSHTAADFFTGELRDAFQQRFGNGGVGFISPLAVPGQRYEQVVMPRAGSDWVLKTSRRDLDDVFSLGGSHAQPQGHQRSMTIAFRDESASLEPLRARAFYKTEQPNLLIAQDGHGRHEVALSQSQWGYSTPITLTLPVTMTVQNGAAGTQIGGWYLDRSHGVVLSSIGSNGASLSLLEHWQNDWYAQLQKLHPAMIILAYGTNESLNKTLDFDQYRQSYVHIIWQLRQENPTSVILMVGPSDNASARAGGNCRHMVGLEKIIATQRAVARQEHVLYWDWRAFMGGACSINSWRAHHEGQEDRVHLLRPGYQRSARGLYKNIMKILNIAP